MYRLVLRLWSDVRSSNHLEKAKSLCNVMKVTFFFAKSISHWNLVARPLSLFLLDHALSIWLCSVDFLAMFHPCCALLLHFCQDGAQTMLMRFLFSHSDTVGRSGMFCAIVTTIERCKTEGVVDVFQVVKALRVQKPGAVLTVVSGTYIASFFNYG